MADVTTTNSNSPNFLVTETGVIGTPSAPIYSSTTRLVSGEDLARTDTIINSTSTIEGITKVSRRKLNYNDKTKKIKMVDRKIEASTTMSSHPFAAELEQHRQTGQYITVLKKIHPHEAEHILEYFNNVNREIGTAKGQERVADFVSYINNNEWLVAPCHFIAFFGGKTPAFEGDVATGQARLMSCVVSGQPIYIYVVIGVSEEDREAFDRAAMNKYDQVQMRYVGTGTEEAKLFLEVYKYMELFEQGYKYNGSVISPEMTHLKRKVDTSHSVNDFSAEEANRFFGIIRKFPTEVVDKKGGIGHILRRPTPTQLKDLTAERVDYTYPDKKIREGLAKTYRKALLMVAYDRCLRANKADVFISVVREIYSSKPLSSRLEQSMRRQLVKIGVNDASRLVETTAKIAMVFGDFVTKLIQDKWHEEVISTRQ